LAKPPNLIYTLLFLQCLNPFEAVGRNSVKSCAPDVSDLKYAQTNRGGRLSAANNIIYMTSFARKQGEIIF